MHCDFQLPGDLPQRLHDAISQHLRPDLFSSVGWLPSPEQLRTCIEVAFWTSLLADEGRPAIFSLSIAPRANESNLILFAPPLPLAADRLAKLFPATVPLATAIRVGPTDDSAELHILGLDPRVHRGVPVPPVQILVRGPGKIYVRSASATIAVMQGTTVNLVDRRYYNVFALLGKGEGEPFSTEWRRERRIRDVVKAMHAHGHGGTLLVAGTDELVGVTAQYELRNEFVDLEALEEERDAAYKSRLGVQTEITSAQRKKYVEAIARTTAVDGATVVAADCALRCFGAKIAVDSRTLSVRKESPAVGTAPHDVSIGEFGGMRHQSAARFVAKNVGSRAVVASQDGKVSILRHENSERVFCLEHLE